MPLISAEKAVKLIESPDLVLIKHVVTAKSRKLSAEWTIEEQVDEVTEVNEETMQALLEFLPLRSRRPHRDRF